MNKDNIIRHLQDWVQHYEMVLALLDEKQAKREREPAEAYWYGGCP